MDVDSDGLSSAKRDANAVLLLDLATVGVAAAWFVIACFAITYLISH